MPNKRLQRTAEKRGRSTARRWAPEKAVSVDVVQRGRRIGGPSLTQELIELLVCEQRVHVCGGREAEEQAVIRPGEQRP